MVHKSLIKKLFLFLIAVFLFSCNAPRDNPLDPNSSKADLVQIKPTLGQIEGTVQPLIAPFTGIPSVSVFWLPENIVVKTNNSGNFTISNIKPVDGLLIFQKDGYTPDTVSVKWDNTLEVSAPIVNLNKIPTLDSYLIYSEVINQSGQTNLIANQSANLVFKIKINDSDNDIDSVYVKNDIMNFTDGLTLVGKVYQATFSTTDLKINDMEKIVGYNFDVRVMDNVKRLFLIGSNKVARVIKTGSEIISPASDTLLVPFNLHWNQFNAGYPFTYKIEIYNSANLTVFTQDSIQSDQDSLTIADTTIFIQGDYSWAVSIVDQFSDSYKSQLARFHIK